MSNDVAAVRAACDPQPPRPPLAILGGEGEPRFNRNARLIFALIVVLFVALRVWNLTAYGLFSDEVFSAETVHRAWPQMQLAIIEDVVHPPLFYYLLKAWIIATDSLLWMKLFPVFFAALTVIPFVLLGRELRLRAATINLALFLMAVNEYLVGYGQELRMYSLLMLLVTASMWLFAKMVNASNRALAAQLGLLATNLLLVYTHYYGWLIVACELLFVVMRRRERLAAFAASTVVVAAAFFPWAFAVMGAAYAKGGLGPNLKWNPRPTANDFFQHYVTLDGPIYNSWRAEATIFSTVICLTPILIWTWQCVKAKGKRQKAKGKNDNGSNLRVAKANEADGQVLLWLALLAFLPSIIAFAASYLLAQSVWGSRFLIVVAPAYLLLVAIAVTRLSSRRWRFIAVVLAAAWATLSGALQLTHRDKVNWQPLVAQMIHQEVNLSDDLHVYTRQGVVGVTTQYYLNQSNDERFRVQYVDDYSDINDAHFWLAFIRYRHETGPLPIEWFAARGDRVGEAIEADAPGHKVIFVPVWRRDGNH
jgi:hypothetical protein